MKNERGITLIALIITIIVLLLLAGVSLNAVIGDNGIVTRARDAKINTEEAELKEQIEMVIADALSVKMANPQTTQNEIRDYIKNQFQEKELKATIENDENWYVIVYGIYKKNIWYLTEELKDIKEDLAVIGNTEDWIYEVDPETQKALLTGYNYEHLGSTIVIPNVIDGYLISGLGDQVFMLRTGLKEVTFSEGLRTIGDKAFSGCSNLTKINDFPSTLKSIGSEAFYGCSNLELNLTFNDYLKTIGDRAFCKCSKITGTVNDLLRKSVSYGENVFSECSSITGDIGQAMSVLISDTDTEIPANLFSGMSGLTGTIVIGPNIEKIGDNAFHNCIRINKIDLSNATNLKIIGQYALAYCTNMKGDLNFCEGLQEIGASAFQCDNNIDSVYFPSTLTSIKGSFRYSGVKSVVFNCGDVIDTEWGECFGKAPRLKDVEFLDTCTITTIPKRMFRGCISLESIELFNNIKVIGEEAFWECSNLKNIKYSENLENIGAGAFKECTQLTDLPILNNNLINSIITISDEAFYKCTNLGKKENSENTDIISLLESSNITTIGKNAFYDCIYLSGEYDILKNKSTLEIAIGINAFFNTKIGKSVIFDLSNRTIIDENYFIGVTKFKDASGNEIKELKIPEGITTIGKNAFASCASITSVSLPASLTSLNDGAFYSCSNLSTVEYKGNSIQTIPISLFENCSSLNNVNFSNIKYINGKAFLNCLNLNNFVFENGLLEIGEKSFYGSGLINVEIPQSVTNIDVAAFSNCKSLEKFDCSKSKIIRLQKVCQSCSSLKDVKLPNTLTNLYGWNFSETAIESINIPTSVYSMYEGEFYNCKSLKRVSGLDSISTLPHVCFQGCTMLEEVSSLKNITRINNGLVFENCSNLTLDGLKEINWSKINYIGDGNFYNCINLIGTVNISQSCQVSSSAFTNCPLDVRIGY